MSSSNRKDRRGSWVIGGTTLIGIGVGFVLLRTSVLYFVAAVLVGIGLGLVMASLISGREAASSD